MTAPVRRTDLPGAVGENRQRIEALERVPSLHYGSNEGDWIDLIANGVPTGDSLHGYNIFLHTTDDTYGDLPGPGPVPDDGGSIVLAAGRLTPPFTASFIALYGTDLNGATGALFVGDIGITQPVPPYNTYIFHGAGVALGLSDPLQDQNFAVCGREVLHCLEIRDNYVVDWLVNDYTITLANTAVFEVHDGSGNPIFRIDQDGALHGKTGESLTFDL